MSDVIFTNQADALAFSAEMDTRSGYPKDGVNIGGGRFAPVSVGRTVRHAQVFKHPVRSEWSYAHDAPVQAEIGRGLVIPPTGSVQIRDATWNGAMPVPDGK